MCLTVVFFTKKLPAFLLVILNSKTTTMPTAAILKVKYEAEKAERQRREDEEKAREADMLKEIAEVEDAEKKVAEKAEEEWLEREKQLLEEAWLALAAKKLADEKAAKEAEEKQAAVVAVGQKKTMGASRVSSPVKTKVVQSGGDGDCWPCRTAKQKKVCIFPP